MTVILRSFVTALLCSTALLQAHCQLFTRGGPMEPADFQAVRNDVYDVSASQEIRGIAHRNQLESAGPPFPQRMALKVEGSSSEFNACGGFSGGRGGTCCKACMRLNFKQGCWCRTWDCLCFNS